MLLNDEEIVLQFFLYSPRMIPEGLKEKEFSQKKYRHKPSGTLVIDHERDCSASFLPEGLHDAEIYMKEAFWQLRDGGVYVPRFFFSKEGNPRTENPLMFSLQSLTSNYCWEAWAFEYRGKIKTVNFGSPRVPRKDEKPKSYLYVMNGGIHLQDA
jgi:hypothetical protein